MAEQAEGQSGKDELMEGWMNQQTLKNMFECPKRTVRTYSICIHKQAGYQFSAEFSKPISIALLTENFLQNKILFLYANMQSRSKVRSLQSWISSRPKHIYEQIEAQE